MKPASYCYIKDEEWDYCIDRFDAIARSCALCPRNCGVNRHAGERGFCGAPGGLFLSSAFPHHGEEPSISGTGGSGTIFFSHCTLRCCYCQNYQISHLSEGLAYTPAALATKMMELQDLGCHNINLVTATHFLPWVIRALREAAQKGLVIPIVYNSGGYELASVISLLSGIVDIYLPDMKYGCDESARDLSGAGDYSGFNQAAVREMFRQAGPLTIGSDGLASRGMCIRHLVLPCDMAGSGSVLDFLKKTFDPADIHVSLMAQYRPLFKASTVPEINRMITSNEYERVKEAFVEAGFSGFYQTIGKDDDNFVIDFTRQKSEPLKRE